MVRKYTDPLAHPLDLRLEIGTGDFPRPHSPQELPVQEGRKQANKSLEVK